MFKTWVNAVGVKAPFFGSCENEDSENDNIRPPLRKRRQITKTKTHHENEDTFLTSSKEVGTTFVDKDYVHETHYENGRAPWSLQWDYFKAKTREAT